VLHATFEHVCHSFKSSVRMIGRAFRFAWDKVLRPHLIEQQKWIEVGQRVRWKRPVHEKTFTFERLNTIYDPRHGPDILFLIGHASLFDSCKNSAIANTNLLLVSYWLIVRLKSYISQVGNEK
jgi:hypothetical protein